MNSMDVEGHEKIHKTKARTTKNFFKEKIKKMNLYAKITKNFSKN